MTAEVISNTSPSNEEALTFKERESAAESLGTFVIPRLTESDWGVARHRLPGEPGSLRGVERQDSSERPDDN